MENSKKIKGKGKLLYPLARSVGDQVSQALPDPVTTRSMLLESYREEPGCK